MLVWMAACAPDETAQVSTMLDETELAPLESFGVTFFFTDSAYTRAKLETAHVIEREETDEEGKPMTINYFNGGVRIQFFDPLGNIESTVVSDSGSFRRETGLAELNENVVVNSVKNERLETEQLFWDQTKDSVYTRQYVRITTPDEVIIGRKGLRSNTRFTQYVIFGISGEMAVEEE